MSRPDSDAFNIIQRELAIHDAAMEATSCGISISDARQPDMPLIYVNRAFIELSGYSEEHVLGKNCRFLQGDDRDQDARHIIREALNTGSHCQVLLRNYRKDGSFFWNELIISPIHNDAGEVTHFVGVQNDVTDREEARQETAAKLHKEADLDFITEDLDDLIHSSIEGLNRVKGIVGSLRNFSRLDEAEEKVASLKECIESTLEIAGPAVKNKLEITCQLEDLPTIKCRPSELNQVFLNLIINASQAVDQKGRLEIKGRDTEESLILTFTDNGQGMDKATQEKIFNPFFTTKPVGEGTGLGLSIAYKIITEGHNGTITVESEVGKGSTFKISLPKTV